MRLTLIFSFFIFLNFMLILLPKMMPNVISLEQTLFWVFWVNGLFVLTLILPAKASYIFESMSKAKLVTEAIGEQFLGKKESKRSSDPLLSSSRPLPRPRNFLPLPRAGPQPPVAHR